MSSTSANSLERRAKTPTADVSEFSERYEYTAEGLLKSAISRSGTGDSRSMKGITSARQLLARDLFDLKRVYPDIPNSKFRELIDMNLKMYPEMRK